MTSGECKCTYAIRTTPTAVTALAASAAMAPVGLFVASAAIASFARNASCAAGARDAILLLSKNATRGPLGKKTREIKPFSSGELARVERRSGGTTYRCN